MVPQPQIYIAKDNLKNLAGPHVNPQHYEADFEKKRLNTRGQGSGVKGFRLHITYDYGRMTMVVWENEYEEDGSGFLQDQLSRRKLDLGSGRGHLRGKPEPCVHRPARRIASAEAAGANSRCRNSGRAFPFPTAEVPFRNASQGPVASLPGGGAPGDNPEDADKIWKGERASTPAGNTRLWW